MPNTHSTLTALFSDIADAIRSKAGSSAPIVADAFPSAIAAIPSGGGGGGDEGWTKLVDKTISQAIDSSGEVLTVGSYAFYNCYSLTTASFPVATNIGRYAFVSCSALTTVSFPSVSSIYDYAFSGCSKLTEVTFPMAQYINSNAFFGCSSLTAAYFPSARTLSTSAFGFCQNLATVSFPEATTVYAHAFRMCHSLSTVILPKVTSIGASAFAYCYNLVSLYLSAQYVCTLNNSNAFTSTPIGGYSESAGQYGSIYVPASLYSNYCSANVWAFFSDRIVSV